jgi:hypothetical protein
MYNTNSDSQSPSPKKGYLCRIKDKRSDKSPDFEGSIPIDDKTYKLAGWVRVSKAGNKYLSLSARLDTSQDQDRPQTQVTSPSSAPKAEPQDEQLEELPF